MILAIFYIHSNKGTNVKRQAIVTEVPPPKGGKRPLPRPSYREECLKGIRYQKIMDISPSPGAQKKIPPLPDPSEIPNPTPDIVCGPDEENGNYHEDGDIPTLDPGLEKMLKGLIKRDYRKYDPIPDEVLNHKVCCMMARREYQDTAPPYDPDESVAPQDSSAHSVLQKVLQETAKEPPAYPDLSSKLTAMGYRVRNYPRPAPPPTDSSGSSTQTQSNTTPAKDIPTTSKSTPTAENISNSTPPYSTEAHTPTAEDLSPTSITPELSETETNFPTAEGIHTTNTSTSTIPLTQQPITPRQTNNSKPTRLCDRSDDEDGATTKENINRGWFDFYILSHFLSHINFY